MSFSSFYIVQLSNEHYIEHIMRGTSPVAEGQNILPYHIKQDSPCEHNLPTPCPPSTPILVQLTNSGRPNTVSSHQGPKEDFIQRLHNDLINRSAINILNDLNNSPAVEAISPIRGSRHDHSFYICRLCYPKRTHIMNIGATLHHITQYHISEHHNYRDKLTQEAFDHLTEVRHLLQQSNDRRVFTIIRSSSDSLPIITWRGNNLDSDTTSFNMAEDRVSSIGNPIQKAHSPLATKLPKGPPTKRNVKVYGISTTRNMINAGLSLDLSNIFPTSNNRLGYTKNITEIVDTPIEAPTNEEKNSYETHIPATTPTRTRYGGVRKGTFDKQHNFRRFRS